MTKNTTKTAAVAAGTMLFDDWFDPIEDAVRETVRGVIETIMEEELDATLSRPRYGRRKAAGSIDDAAPIVGSRHGHQPCGPKRLWEACMYTCGAQIGSDEIAPQLCMDLCWQTVGCR